MEDDQSLWKKLSESIVTNLAQLGAFATELSYSGQQIGNRTAGVGFHGGVAHGVGGFKGEVDQQFANGGYIIHVFFHPF